MNAEILLAIVGSGGLGAVGAALISGLFSKRRLTADATQIITKAAGGLVERMDTRLARAEERVSELEAERERAEEREENWRAVLQLHAAWDHLAIKALEDHGVEDMPPAPPLLLPKMLREVKDV